VRKLLKDSEVTPLSALVSSKEALTQLCDNGRFEVLSLVMGEGELSVIAALMEERLSCYLKGETSSIVHLHVI